MTEITTNRSMKGLAPLTMSRAKRDSKARLNTDSALGMVSHTLRKERSKVKESGMKTGFTGRGPPSSSQESQCTEVDSRKAFLMALAHGFSKMVRSGTKE